MDPSATRSQHASNMSTVGQLLLDNEKAVRKLSKVRQRRDHYARLYFQTLAELEETKWKLSHAMNTIRDLQAQGQVSASSIPRQMMFHSNTTSPDSGSSLSPGIDRMDSPAHRRHQHCPPVNPGIAYRAQGHGKEPVREAWLGREAWHDYPNGQWVGTALTQYPRHLYSSQLIGTHLHPPPGSHHASSQHHSHHLAIRHSALPASQTNFVRSWSMSVPHQDVPPISPGGVTPSSASSVFTLPPDTNPPLHCMVDHTHQDHIHPPKFLRSKTLPSSGKSVRPPLENTKLSSLSHENLLGDDNARSRKPTFSLSHENLLTDNSGRKSAFTLQKVPAHGKAGRAPVGEASQLAGHAAAPSESQRQTNVDKTAPGRYSTENRGVFAVRSAPPPPENDGEHSSYYCENLSSVDMLDLLLNISSPQCKMQRLVVQRSRLGELEAMKLFCNSLARNRSIRELSLPDNGIRGDGLALLLETIKAGTSIKELQLQRNLIGEECAGLIKQFLADTMLDSLVLTGNRIEQFGHLLEDKHLQNEFSIEYSSDDSGVHTVTPSANDPSPQFSSTFKYLHI